MDEPLVFPDDFQDEPIGSNPDYWMENSATDNWRVMWTENQRYFRKKAVLNALGLDFGIA